jgi:hypothetical protein
MNQAIEEEEVPKPRINQCQTPTGAPVSVMEPKPHTLLWDGWDGVRMASSARLRRGEQAVPGFQW